MKLSQITRQLWRYGRATLLALLTPLLEKNQDKTKVSKCHVPVVLSMSRVIVLLFAAAMLVQINRAGVAGWPDATLCIAVVLAIPLLSSLERLKAGDAVKLANAIIGRFGEGATRQIGNVYSREPSKHDDHRVDADHTDRRRDGRGYDRPPKLKKA